MQTHSLLGLKYKGIYFSLNSQQEHPQSFTRTLLRDARFKRSLGGWMAETSCSCFIWFRTGSLHIGLLRLQHSYVFLCLENHLLQARLYYGAGCLFVPYILCQRDFLLKDKKHFFFLLKACVLLYLLPVMKRLLKGILLLMSNLCCRTVLCVS